jgi:heme-degrading monooxygenase HmoA
MSDGKVRIAFLLTLRPGAGDTFLAAYEAVRWQVAGTPGHLVDQVCQSATDPDQWLITSEWESLDAFIAWEKTPRHRELAAAMMATVLRSESLRFQILAETPGETRPQSVTTARARR